MMISTKITEIMSTDVLKVGVDTSITEIYKLLKENNIHHMPVIGKNGEFAGMISYYDIAKLFHPSTTFNHPSGWEKTKDFMRTLLASEIMTKDVFSLGTESTIGAAVGLFSENQFHCIPILKDNKIVGILTPFDLIQHCYKAV